MIAKNLYPGINPHLNSALQQRGNRWRSFHTYHLVHIAQVLNQILPENYYASPEESLQIGVYDAEMFPSSFPTDTSIADVLILKEKPTQTASAAIATYSTPTLTLPVQAILEEQALDAVIISDIAGHAVTRVEVLSPANKPGGSYHGKYLEKRLETLRSGLCLVEIDYLHERRPLTSQIPSYADKQPGAMPYHILITDPHPEFSPGKTDVYGFRILDKLPIVPIPLEKAEFVVLDLGNVYAMTVAERPFRVLIDYTQLPTHFEAYTQHDQIAIQQFMAAIKDGNIS